MGLRTSLIIPTLGDRIPELTRLFDSLTTQTNADIELIVVAQDNHSAVKELCDLYSDRLSVKCCLIEKKGLSLARNAGLKYVSGDVLVLADDDCWYRSNSIEHIAGFFENNPDADILLTQIYDPEQGVQYKNYSKKRAIITRRTELLSRSSIEIAVRMKAPIIEVDEAFGLGAKYASGEDNDYLIRALQERKKIYYEHVVTVLHRKKPYIESREQVIAKGAFYSKHMGFIVSNAVLLRDLIQKHQNNYRWFWFGYFDYKKIQSRREEIGG